MLRMQLFLLATCGASALAQSPLLRIDVQDLTPRVRIFSGFANGNVLVLASRDGLLLVDAQTTKRVGSLDSAIRVYSTAPVRWVINTHYHDDHTQGNAHYRAAGAEIIAHRNVKVQASKDTLIPEMEWRRTPLPAAALPTRTFDDTLSILAGGIRVFVRHPGPAHTDGDAIIWIAQENVLHIGDQFEVGAPPFVDWWAGGSVDGMISAVDLGLAIANDSTRIVPGHGAVSSRADLVRYREMLATVQARVRSGLAAGKSGDALAAEAVAGYEQLMGGARRAAQFGKQVVQGLSRK